MNNINTPHLNRDVFYNIYSNLPAEDLYRCTRVAQLWREAARHLFDHFLIPLSQHPSVVKYWKEMHATTPEQRWYVLWHCGNPTLLRHLKSTLLHTLAEQGDVATLQLMQHFCKNLNAKDSKGSNLLHIAVQTITQQPQLFQWCLANDIPQILDKYNKSPLHCLAKTRGEQVHLDAIIKLVLRGGAPDSLFKHLLKTALKKPNSKCSHALEESYNYRQSRLELFTTYSQPLKIALNSPYYHGNITVTQAQHRAIAVKQPRSFLFFQHEQILSLLLYKNFTRYSTHNIIHINYSEELQKFTSDEEFHSGPWDNLLAIAEFYGFSSHEGLQWFDTPYNVL